MLVQALVMGIVQGLTEFLPISSSGHLILVPYLAGWDDAFIGSLGFSVMLHLGTLIALLGYFWRDWMRLVPAGLATVRDRSFAGDRDRRMAWLLAVSTVPAVIAGLLLDEIIESRFRQPGIVAIMLAVGGAILWLADRWGSKDRPMDRLSFRAALGIGAAQALALVPGVSRSGISISAGLLLGLDRASAARFSFLMATPVIAGAGAWEARKLLSGEGGAGIEGGPLLAGMVAALISGMAAIHFLLRFLRTNSPAVFVAYRVVLAAVVVAASLRP